MRVRRRARDGIIAHSPGWFALLLKCAAANAAMAAALIAMARPLDWWLELERPARAAWLSADVLAGAVAYFLVLLLLGIRPSTFRLDAE